MKNTDFCNNCGRAGHNYIHCKSPITSFGIIAFRMSEQGPELLMIRRKDSLGFVELLRGKYPLPNREYILNILNEMTIEERDRIKNNNFSTLWNELWNGNVGFQYRGEEKTSREKYESLSMGINVGNDSYSLNTLIEQANSKWEETEWGFPKGRRNYQEKDAACALREFEEETGYSREKVKIVQNLMPYDEVFTGSNYKSYKHRYYLAYMEYEDSIQSVTYEASEVSKISWMTPKECIVKLRPYNKERIEVVEEVAHTLSKYTFIQDAKC